MANSTGVLTTNQQSKTEALAVGIGLGGAAVGLIIGLIFVPASGITLSGEHSIANLAALSVTILGIPLFVFGYRRSIRKSRRRTQRHRSRPLRSVLNTSALTLTAALVSFLLIQAVFVLLQLAFVDLKLQQSSAYVVMAIVIGIASYVLFTLASTVTTRTVSVLLTLFLTSGVLSSMLTTQDPYWWQLNFSSLGVGNAYSSAAFNITIALSGLVVTTMADYLTRDLYDIAVAAELSSPTTRVRAVRILLMVVGIAFMLVGLFPVDEVLIIHNIGAQLLFGGFAALVLVVPLVIRAFSPTFLVMSIIFFILTVWSILLFNPIGYYNLTGLEIVAIFLVFVWLILFVRTVSAKIQDLPQEQLT